VKEAKSNTEKKHLALMGDVRDKFVHAVPLLAPEGFKPLMMHEKLCKICYSAPIDSIIMNCRHKLFCFDCKNFLEKRCPLCGDQITEVVKLYKLKKFTNKVR